MNRDHPKMYIWSYKLEYMTAYTKSMD